MKSSKWKDGKGDVVSDFVNSCAKYDMDIGFYLSPWDQNLPSYPTNVDPDYNDTYIAQMDELFAYADSVGKPVVEFWMDGANGGNNRPKYDIQRWWSNLEAHNPDIVYQQNYGAPLHWCGNESGYSADSCWHVLNKKYVWDLYDTKGQEDKNYLHNGEPYDEEKAKDTEKYDFIWSISEVDVSLRPGWFFHESQKPKNVQKLMEMYFTSVGLGSPFLLNVPANKEGILGASDVAVLKEFREVLDNTFTVNRAAGATATATATRGNSEAYGAANVLDEDYDTYWTMNDDQRTGAVTVDLEKPTLIDVIQIQEYIPLGQRIAAFNTEVKVNGEWKDFGKGGTIGYKRLVKGIPVMAEAIRVTVTDAKAVPLINNISAFKTDERIELEAEIIPGKVEAESASKLSGAVSENKAPNGGGNLGAVRNGAIAEYNDKKFMQTPKQFTLCYSGEGTPEITLRLDSADGPVLAKMQVESAGSYNNYITKTVPVTYTGEAIIGIHKVVLCLNSGLNVDWFELTGVNEISISPNTAKVYEGDALDLTVTRSEEDLSEEVSVNVQDIPDTAVSGQDYESVSQKLTFAPGETTKTLQIQTKHNAYGDADTKFRIELQDVSANGIIGRNGKAIISIRDLDGAGDTTVLENILETSNAKSEMDYMPKSWAEFVKIRNEAEALLDPPGADQKQIDTMAERLSQAMDALLPFRYGEDSPIVFSTKVGERVTTEGELYELCPSEPGEKRIQVEEGSYFHDGKGVSWWQTGDSMKAPVMAKKAGVYTITFDYFSGSSPRNKNTVSISENGVQTAEIAFEPNSSGGVNTEQSVDVTFTQDAVKNAPVLLTIEATANGGPRLDRIYFTLKEAVEVEDEQAVLMPGGTYSIRAELVSQDAEPSKKLRYISSDENVATVSEDGVVTGVAKGEADITVTSMEHSALTAVVKITVTDDIEEFLKGILEKAGEARKAAETAKGKTEEAQGAAETAREEADTARQAAEEAQSGAVQSAEEVKKAQDKAEAAQIAAEDANRKAKEAQDKADTARNSAEAAAKAAEDAKNSAGISAKDAEAARKKAEDAADAAKTAQNNADTAKTAAETARKAAESAGTAAAAAQGKAETAADKAAEAQTKARDAQDRAAEAQTAAETARDAAKGFKDDAQKAAEDAAKALNDALAAKDAAANASAEAIEAKKDAAVIKNEVINAKTAADTARDEAKQQANAANEAMESANLAKTAAEAAADAADTARKLAEAAKEGADAAAREAQEARQAAEAAQKAAEETLKKVQAEANEKLAEAEAKLKAASVLQAKLEELLSAIEFKNGQITVKSVKNAGKRRAAIKWEKMEDAEGYVIQYATNSRFKKAASVKVKGNASVKKTISKLKSRKKYYFRIKAYRTSGGRTIYTKYSGKRTVKIR